MTLFLVPKYLSEFKCIGPACEDTCCAGWNITIDKKTFNLYRNKIQHSEFKKKLEVNVKRNRKSQSDEMYGKFNLDSDNKCNMLLENGLCSIHQELGEEFLCNTCAIYPRHYTKVDQVLESSLTLSCPEAARLVLLRKEGIDFIETEDFENKKTLITSEISSDKTTRFWNLRVFIIQILQDRTQSLEIRLILMGLFLQACQQIKDDHWDIEFPKIAEDFFNRLHNEEFITSLSNIQGNTSFKLNLLRELIRYRLSGGVTSPKYLNILEDIIGSLALEEDAENNVKDFEKSKSVLVQSQTAYYEDFMKEHEYILENYCVNYIFKNLFPYDQENLFKSYMIFIVQFTLIKLHLIGLSAKHKGLTPESVLLCIQQISKVIEHDSNYLQGVLKGLEDADYNTMAHMFVLIK